MADQPTEDEISRAIGVGRILSFADERRKRCENGQCDHQRFVIDVNRGTVECAECGQIVSAFHALCKIAREESRYRDNLHYRIKLNKELDNYKPWLKPVRELERIWRGKMLPLCPHCSEPLKPEDFLSSSVRRK